MALNDSTNGVNFTGLSADTASFRLLGGYYGFTVNATWGGGSVVIKVLMPDGTTYISCSTSYAADSTDVLALPAGTYKIAITTATAVQGSLTPIPFSKVA